MEGAYDVKEKVVYRAEPHVVSTLKSVRERVHHICKQCMHGRVRIQLCDGRVFEGIIVEVDPMHVYLDVSDGYHHGYHHGYRQFFFGGAILPLVLYDLLVISLLW